MKLHKALTFGYMETAYKQERCTLADGAASTRLFGCSPTPAFNVASVGVTWLSLGGNTEIAAQLVTASD